MAATKETLKRHEEQYAEGMSKYGIPVHMRRDLLDYLLEGYPVDGFLFSLLANDLKQTFVEADAENAVAVHRYLLFLYNFTPSTAWGSEVNVQDWVMRGGLHAKGTPRVANR